ncbi:MAG: T9SS type A sorting domain-containing protein [Bacteroidetes bacterium]|nr:T9SS type A sorting domain-containing protein [Bacteroidota bacterium]HET6243586.1 T9SS type A sorting domain-containing protein [Bacteroidia bacterium]
MEKQVESMAFWSVIEGEPGDTYETDIGYIGTELLQKRSTYWHYKMMADNFKGTFFPSVSVNQPNIKAFAAKSSDRIVVMILNEQNSGSLAFKVRLDNTGSVGAGLDIAFNVTGATAGANHVSTVNIQNQSTVLLIFNCKGAISERYDYTLSNAINDQGPQTITIPVATSLIGATISNDIGNAQLCSSGGVCSFFNYTPSNYVYSWTSPYGPVNYTGNSVEYCSLVVGGQTIYTFTATDPSTTCSTTQNVTVNDCGPITGFDFYAYVCGATPSNCGANNGGAMVCAGGASTYSYKWDGGAYGTNSSITGLSPGMHTVVVKNAPPAIGGLTRTLQFYVPITGTQPAISAGPDRTIGRFCRVILTAVPNLTSSGYTYNWYKGTSTTPFSNSYTTNISVWNTATYKVVVTSPSGCTNSDYVNINMTLTPRCITDLPSISTAIECKYNIGSGGPLPPVNVLNSSVIINSDQFIDNVTIVPNNVNLTVIDCELAFSENSKIIVLPGGKLEIRNSFFHGCENLKWGGIEVKGNNNVSDQLIVTGSAFANTDYVIKTDKTLNIYIEDNIFANGITAIELDRNKDFVIRNNYFYNYDIAIKASRTPVANVRSLIKENIFEKVKTAIYFENDNQSKLDIVCNKFDNYEDYAIYAQNTILKDQGSNIEAGNSFVSTSVKLNHKLRHNGNTMNYYYDPSNPVTLVTSGGMSAIAQAASSDGTCSDINDRRSNPNPNVGSDPVYGNSKSKLDLYSAPNPNSGEATIYYNLGEEKQGTLTIMDMYGNVMNCIKVTSESNQVNSDYSNYSSGIYMISLTNSKSEVINKKMIIAK